VPDSPTLADVEGGLAMPLVEAMQTQRAMRRLRPDPLDDSIVLRCIELALKAPTSSNGQNWEWIVVKDPAVKQKLAVQYTRVWALYGRSLRRRTRGDDSARRSLDAADWLVVHLAEVPVLVVACLRGGRVPLLPHPPLVESSYYGSIYPSVQNLLLAARGMGVGAALITLPLWSVTAARRILGLPVTVRPCCIVPMGWPTGRYGPTRRKPVGDVTHLDRFGRQPWRDQGVALTTESRSSGRAG
jgi:nitroreductase